MYGAFCLMRPFPFFSQSGCFLSLFKLQFTSHLPFEVATKPLRPRPGDLLQAPGVVAAFTCSVLALCLSVCLSPLPE
jgi:hypothetical protein